MKRISYLVLAIIVSTLGLSSCSTDNIAPWDTSNNYVWFTNTIQEFTFMATGTPVGDSWLVPIQFQVAGVVADHDRQISVEIAEDPRDSRTEFEIQQPVLFRANHIVDTMYVKVVNGAHLSHMHDTISFRLKSNNDFQVGRHGNLVTALSVFDGLPRPEWWDELCEYYLGYFTQQKMQVYITVTGGDGKPYDEDSYAGNMFQFIKYELNDYVQKNNVCYPDDDPNAPGMLLGFNRLSY